MPRAATLLMAALLLTTCTTSSASPTEVSTPAAIPDPVGQCLRGASYRATFTETDPETGDVLVELIHEVGPAHLRVESTAAPDVLFVASNATEAWSYVENEWTLLPAMPVRPLRVPWVNNFVTAQVIADNATPSSNEQLHGFEVGVYKPTFAALQQALPRKFDGAGYEAIGSSFTYWIDPCGDIIQAAIDIAFDAETAELLPDFPATLRYDYSLYDIDAPLRAITPKQPDAPGEIPRN